MVMDATFKYYLEFNPKQSLALTKELIDEVKKLNDDMTETIKVAEPLVKKNNKNIMFMTSIQGLIRFNTRLNEIYKKLKKN